MRKRRLSGLLAGKRHALAHQAMQRRLIGEADIAPDAFGRCCRLAQPDALDALGAGQAGDCLPRLADEAG